MTRFTLSLQFTTKLRSDVNVIAAQALQGLALQALAQYDPTGRNRVVGEEGDTIGYYELTIQEVQY